MMLITTVTVKSTATMTAMLQEILTGIILEGLTTMLFPCTSAQGKYIIARHPDLCNSTLEERVLISRWNVGMVQYILCVGGENFSILHSDFMEFHI